MQRDSSSYQLHVCEHYTKHHGASSGFDGPESRVWVPYSSSSYWWYQSSARSEPLLPQGTFAWLRYVPFSRVRARSLVLTSVKRLVRMLQYIVRPICLFIGQEPTFNFRNQRNLQIRWWSASRWLKKVQVSRAINDFQVQCQTVFRTTVFLSLFSSNV